MEMDIEMNRYEINELCSLIFGEKKQRFRVRGYIYWLCVLYWRKVAILVALQYNNATMAHFITKIAD